MNGNNLKQIDALIYKLKREYGVPIYLRQPIVNDVDVTTGEQLRRYTVYKVRRAILMPSNTVRDFVYDLTYVAANKNFAYGAFFDKDSRIFIIDEKNIVPDTSWHMIYNEQKYEIVSVDNSGPLLIASKAIMGVPPIKDPYGVE
jgi:hypothetical protein